MKVSVNWVKEYTDVKLSIDELVEKIGAQLGAVEEVIDLGKKYQGIVVAKVVSCEKHTDADKLSICKIDDGGKVKGVKRDTKGLVQVVCGAPNVKAGMLVAWLPPGTTVPATFDKEPFKLEAREIRGQMSYGMLASASELEISDDHSGILEIDNPGLMEHKDPAIDINDHVAAVQNIIFKTRHKPGDDFAKAFGLDDYIIDIENKMFTHRPDLFGILGVAREIAGITNHKFTSPKWYSGDKVSSEHNTGEHLLKIHNKLPKLVPRFMARIVENVSVVPSSLYLQTLLARVGIRPINNVVDVTNYIMYLTGQPMHAYDYDKVKALDSNARHATITVRHPEKGEKLKLLNGKTLEPRPEDIMIASATKLIGIGGVMGGTDTEVDENTENIILESANFNMYSIRKTAMGHGLFTDAVTRFTKGQSPLQNDRALAWAVDNIVHETGGIPARSTYDAHKQLPKPNSVRVSPTFINDRLGLSLSAKKITELLENVEFKIIQSAGKQLAISPPFWRTDIEIPEDIVEEVGRLYGYDHLPLELPRRSIKPTKRNEMLDFKTKIRDVLSKAGANEILTYSFVHGDLIDTAGQDRKKAYRLSNALSPDLQYYRLSLTPSLLEKVHPNIKASFDEFAIFEIGKAHNKDASKDGKEAVPKEFENLALVVASNDKTDDESGSPYFRARHYLDYLAKEMGAELTYEVFEKEPDYLAAKPFDYKRSARVHIKDGEKLIIGIVGEFKSEVKRSLKLPSQVAGFEIGLTEQMQKPRHYRPISRFPKVQQDISLKVLAKLSYGELFDFVKESLDAPNNTLVEWIPLDIYQSKDDKIHKHVTFRMSIVSYERTMTDQEVNKLLDEIAANAHEKFGAERI